MARNTCQAALEILDGGEHVALVTIVGADGFVPVSAMSKLLVTSTGTLLGRSGSDILDADIRAEAQRVLAQGLHSARQFCVLDKDVVGRGWYRAWTVELLIEPLRELGYEMLRALVALEDTRHRGTLATILTEHPRYPAGCRKFLVCDDGTLVGRRGDTRLAAAVRCDGLSCSGRAEQARACRHGWRVERREKYDASLFELLDRKRWEGRVERMARGAARSRGADGLD